MASTPPRGPLPVGPVEPDSIDRAGAFRSSALGSEPSDGAMVGNVFGAMGAALAPLSGAIERFGLILQNLVAKQEEQTQRFEQALAHSVMNGGSSPLGASGAPRTPAPASAATPAAPVEAAPPAPTGSPMGSPVVGAPVAGPPSPLHAGVAGGMNSIAGAAPHQAAQQSAVPLSPQQRAAATLQAAAVAREAATRSAAEAARAARDAFAPQRGAAAMASSSPLPSAGSSQPTGPPRDTQLAGSLYMNPAEQSVRFESSTGVEAVTMLVPFTADQLNGATENISKLIRHNPMLLEEYKQFIHILPDTGSIADVTKFVGQMKSRTPRLMEVFPLPLLMHAFTAQIIEEMAAAGILTLSHASGGVVNLGFGIQRLPTPDALRIIDHGSLGDTQLQFLRELECRPSLRQASQFTAVVRMDLLHIAKVAERLANLGDYVVVNASGEDVVCRRNLSSRAGSTPLVRAFSDHIHSGLRASLKAIAYSTMGCDLQDLTVSQFKTLVLQANATIERQLHNLYDLGALRLEDVSQLAASGSPAAQDTPRDALRAAAREAPREALSRPRPLRSLADVMAPGSQPPHLVQAGAAALAAGNDSGQERNVSVDESEAGGQLEAEEQLAAFGGFGAFPRRGPGGGASTPGPGSPRAPSPHGGRGGVGSGGRRASVDLKGQCPYDAAHKLCFLHLKSGFCCQRATGEHCTHDYFNSLGKVGQIALFDATDCDKDPSKIHKDFHFLLAGASASASRP